MKSHSTHRDTPVGRRPVTTRADLERIALDLFHRRGFDETTVEDIAAAAGIGRRTFFRYYQSKNDVVWGDFDGELSRLRALLEGYPRDLPLIGVLHQAVLAFNTVDPAQQRVHRQRMSLILRVPALQAHSTLRYAAWRGVIAGFVAGRLDVPVDTLMPQVVAQALLGVSVAGYEQWLADPDSELIPLLDAALDGLVTMLGGRADGRRSAGLRRTPTAVAPQA